MNGLSEVELVENKIGKVEVLKLFNFSKIGIIAGSIVREGVVKRDSIIEVFRNNKLIGKTKVNSLKFEKNNIKEVSSGKECGIVLKDKDIKIKEGDFLLVKELVKKEK